MSELMVTMTAALAAELLLVSFVLLLVAWLRARAARRRDNKAIRVLVTRIKNTRNEREATITRYLGEQLGLSGEPLQQAKTAISRAELLLLQRFAGVYMKRDAGGAAQFDLDFAAAVTPYQEVQTDGVEVALEEAAADSSELEQLRAENARLSEELGVTMETMSRMLNEYSSMFAGGAEAVAAPAAQFEGSAGTVATDPGEREDSEAQHASPPPDVDLQDGADVDIMAEAEFDEESDVAASAQVVAEVGEQTEVPADDDIGREIDDAEGIAGTADVMIQGDDNAAMVAEGQDAGADVVVKDRDHALFAAEDDANLLDGLEQDTAVASATDEPEAVGAAQDPAPEIEMPDRAEPEPVADAGTGDRAQGDIAETSADVGDGQTVEPAEIGEVLDELLGDAPVEAVPEVDEQAGDEAAQVSGEEIAGLEDVEIAADRGEEPAAIEIEAGDDLETVTDLLEEAGPAEIVAFDESGDLDVALAAGGDELFDPAEPETIARAEAAEGDLFDSIGNGAEPGELDGLFDGIDEPLKTQTSQ